jgi:hypothetical protein
MANDELMKDVIIDKLSSDQPKEQVEEIFNACKEVTGANSCERAYKMFECYLSYKQ